MRLSKQSFTSERLPLGLGDPHSKCRRGRFLNLPLFARPSSLSARAFVRSKADKRLLRGHSCGGHTRKTGWWKKWKRHDPARIIARPRCATSRDETRRTSHARRTISENADAGAGRCSDEAIPPRARPAAPAGFHRKRFQAPSRRTRSIRAAIVGLASSVIFGVFQTHSMQIAWRTNEILRYVENACRTLAPMTTQTYASSADSEFHAARLGDVC